jgi:hypothetical protein
LFLNTYDPGTSYGGLPWHRSDWFPCHLVPLSCEHTWHSLEQRRDLLDPCWMFWTLTLEETGGSWPMKWKTTDLKLIVSVFCKGYWVQVPRI